MDKQRKEKLIDVLELGTEGNLPPGKNMHDVLDLRSLELLDKAGYIRRKDMFTTLSGLSYLERLKAPRKAWFKDNWFPALVAAATIVFAGVSAGVQLVDLLTSNSGSSMVP